jgi:NAD(P)-dependent dehydrogenase (short-subunit alcohol dehydrogenase family)
MGRLDGKRAVIVGAATGMGAQTARSMAAEGASVVIGDIKVDTADQVARDIREAGGRCEAVWVDVSSEDAVRDLMDQAAEQLGGIDVLHNNAFATDEVALDDARRPLLDIASEVFDHVLHINLRGYWLGSKYALPHMLQAGGGSIINTASIISKIPMTTSGAYSVSKGGIDVLTTAIATQYGRQGIRCNAISPGMIQTGYLTEEYGDMLVPHNLVPRLGVTSDIAAAAVYLASDESAFVTGQILAVDGGLSVHVPTYADLVAQADLVANQRPTERLEIRDVVTEA